MYTLKQITEHLESKKEDIYKAYELNGYHDVSALLLSECIENIHDDYKGDDITFEDSYALIDALEYNGAISSVADSETPIMNYALREWFDENYDAVEEYMEEFGTQTDKDARKIDIHRIIQCAYCMLLSNDIRTAFEKLLAEIAEDAE